MTVNFTICNIAMFTAALLQEDRLHHKAQTKLLYTLAIFFRTSWTLRRYKCGTVVKQLFHWNRILFNWLHKKTGSQSIFPISAAYQDHFRIMHKFWSISTTMCKLQQNTTCCNNQVCSAIDCVHNSSMFGNPHNSFSSEWVELNVPLVT